MQKSPSLFDVEIAAFRRQLDFYVLKAEVIHFLGNLGCLFVFSMGIIIVLAGVEITFVPEGLPGTPWLFIGSIVAVILLLRMRPVGEVPNRLTIARCGEGQSSELGECISRAVDFLDSGGLKHSQNDQASQLRVLAVLDAAKAAKTTKYFPVPHGRVYTFWMIAGCLSVVLVMASLGISDCWAESVNRQLGLTPQDHADATDSIQSHSHVTDQRSDADVIREALVTQCREQFQIAAYVQDRLSRVMSLRFAAAPGQRVESLKKATRNDLRSLVEIYNDTVVRIQRAQSKLVQLHPSIDERIMNKCAVLSPNFLSQVVEAIELNQLARAAEGTSFVASILREIVLDLGGSDSSVEGDRVEYSQWNFSDIRQAQVKLDEIEKQDLLRLENVNEGQGVTFTASHERDSHMPRVPYESQSRTAQGSTMNTSVSTDPGFMAGGASSSLVTQARDSSDHRVSRSWNLLPEDVQIHVQRSGFAEVPPEYKKAVELYYGIGMGATISDNGESDLP